MQQERPPPLFMLSQLLHKRPSFQHFSVQDPHFNQKSQNFPIFCSKCLNCLNLVNFQFLSLKIGQNSIQEAPFGPKISSESSIFVKKKCSASSQIWCRIHSTSPIFSAPCRISLFIQKKKKKKKKKKISTVLLQFVQTGSQ